MPSLPGSSSFIAYAAKKEILQKKDCFNALRRCPHSEKYPDRVSPDRYDDRPLADLWHHSLHHLPCGKAAAPEVILLASFLLNCGISVLTGTSFGTAATIGVICMSMGVSEGANPLLLGGAILSGAFFGDRCSPFSTSALFSQRAD